MAYLVLAKLAKHHVTNYKLVLLLDDDFNGSVKAIPSGIYQAVVRFLTCSFTMFVLTLFQKKTTGEPWRYKFQ